ncbi:MAG TPA: molybdate ABC transporter substrate-binding protein [Chromatiales bacterium]|nr:molybdate ABC transporter substrate-binding protein [Chromatiales bacterium]HEX22337.1 molybdate ABC transporter substrate-binding protein [Chromatiales bacterium]
MYAQIHHGAPFDALFAADEHRPALLEEAGRVRPGSRFTYAIGRLVLWSPDAGRVDAAGRVLSEGRFRHLAIANPKLAPYGRAAQQVLEARGLWQMLRPRLVRGENVGQAWQFVHSGNAELGFVALSQVRQQGQAAAGSHWVVPQVLYAPIVQQAVLLTDNPLAADFLRFVQGDEGRAMIASFGYQLP